MDGDELYTRAMFGVNAVHIPLNLILQNPDESTLVAVVQARMKPELLAKLTRGSKMTHQLILGDAVIRPRIVAESNHLCGVGFAGIMTSADGWNMEEWIKKGKILLEPDK